MEPTELSVRQDSQEVVTPVACKTEQRARPELFGVLESIIRVVSNKPRIEVTNTLSKAKAQSLQAQGINPETSWFYSEQFHPITGLKTAEFIYIPPQILESTDEVAKGKAAHEAGHAAISRHGKFIPQEISATPGFSGLMAAVEERPTDAFVIERFPTAGEWLITARKDAAAYTPDAPRLNTMPQFAQLYSLITYQPYLEETTGYSPEVVEHYERIRPAVEQVAATIPRTGANEAEVINHAKQRYVDTYTHIWPAIQELLAEDQDYQELAELVQLAQQLDESMRSALSQQARATLDALEVLEQQLSQLFAESDDDETGTADQPEPGITGADIRQLSDTLQAAIRALANEMPQYLQEEAKQQATDYLKIIEDQITKELRGVLDPYPTETHEERELREQATRQQAATAQKQAQDNKLLTDQVERFDQNRSNYDQAYDAIRHLDQPLYQRLSEILRPNQQRQTHLRDAGKQVNLRALQRWEADKARGFTRPATVFDRVERPTHRRYAISLLVDRSGSMAGERMTETFRGVVLLAEVLNRLGVPLSIHGFNNSTQQYKAYSEQLNEQARNTLSGLAQWPDGGTNMSKAIAKTSSLLHEQSADSHFLLVLTDGKPDYPELTKKEIAKAQSKKQAVVGVGLGQGTGFVTELFPQGIGNILVDDIPTKLAELLETIIRHPERFKTTI